MLLLFQALSFEIIVDIVMVAPRKHGVFAVSSDVRIGRAHRCTRFTRDEGSRGGSSPTTAASHVVADFSAKSRLNAAADVCRGPQRGQGQKDGDERQDVGGHRGVFDDVLKD